MKSHGLLRATGVSPFRLLHHLLLLPLVLAQNCYYPNGDVSHTDASCSVEGGPCCPLGWECLSNGLCYLENENYFGRYTCTDRNWGLSCPNYCTQNDTAVGNEAIMLCRDGSWCCDRNRDPSKPDCCSWEDKETIDVEPVYVTVTSITSTPKAPSAVPPFTKSSTGAATTRAPSTTSSSQQQASITSTSKSPTTITTRATSSDSTGGIIIITSIITTGAPSTPTSPSSQDPQTATTSPSKAKLIGIGVGVTLGVLSALILLFLLYRHQQKQNAQHRNPPVSGISDLYQDGQLPYMYAHGKNAHEIDSFPVADVGGGGKEGRDKSRPISELTGSNHYVLSAAAPPMSPVSSLSTGTHSGGKDGSPASTVPPPTGYSPNGNVGGGTVAGGWQISPVLPGVLEQPEPQELPAEGSPPSGFGNSTSVTAMGVGAAVPMPAQQQQQKQQKGMGWQAGPDSLQASWYPKMSGEQQRTTWQPGHSQQNSQQVMQNLPLTNFSTNPPAEYEAYSPSREQEATVTRNETQTPANPFSSSSSGSRSRSSGEDALRTSSPDPPQPMTQGGLRVVNQ